MKKKLETDAVIEGLIAAALGDEAGIRERHVWRESLRGLVRLAKAEQVMEIKDSVRKLTGNIETHAARRRAKAVLMAQQLHGVPEGAQRQFEFKD